MVDDATARRLIATGSTDTTYSVSSADNDSGEPRITTVQLGVGGFCVLTGALMAVAPRQFSGPIWSGIQSQLPWVGILFFLAGALHVGCKALGASRRWVTVCHLIAAAALFILAYNLALVSLWPGVVFQVVLAASTAVLPFTQESPLRARGGYSFPFVFGAAIAVFGSIMIVAPEQFSRPYYDPIRPFLLPLGTACLVTGAALLVAQVWPRLPPPVRWTAHLAFLLPSAVLALTIAIPTKTWTDVFIFGGLAPFAASLPWTGPRLRRLDPRSLAVRLTLAMTIVSSLSLIIFAGISTARQDRFEWADAESGLVTSASTLSTDLSDYVGSNRASADALAAYPGLLSLSPADQKSVLLSSRLAFPDILYSSIVDGNGREIVRDDDRPLVDISRNDLFRLYRAGNARPVEVRKSLSYESPVLVFGSSIRDQNGKPVAMIITAVAIEHVSGRLAQVNPTRGTQVYLVDSTGHTIADPQKGIAATFVDLSTTPTVAGLLASPNERGVVRSIGSQGEMLGAFARIPNLGWTVVVEESVGSAVAPLQRAEDEAFGLFLVVVIAATIVGIFAARAFARPLAALSWATNRLSQGDSHAPLPRSGTSEVDELVTSFGHMRNQLVARATEREELLQAEQDARTAAEGALRERDAFLSVAAHELKTPVTSMRGFAQLVLRQLQRTGDVDPGRLTKSMTTIDRQSQRLTKLVDQLLDVTRIESGKLAIERQTVDVAALVKDVVDVFQRLHPQHDFVFAQSRASLVDVDPPRVEQVITNLLDNAVKYSPTGTLIEVDVSPRRGDAVQIMVRDHGAGIPAEVRERIFERYFQVQDGQWHAGLGLGLFISRQIVELHGGSITVDGPVDGGTRFTVLL